MCDKRIAFSIKRKKNKKREKEKQTFFAH